MKIAITKEEFEKLTKEAQAEYTADGEIYNLKLEDEDGKDMGSLRSAKDHEKKRRQEAEKKVRELETKNEELEDKVMDLETGSKDLAEDKKALEEKFEKKFEREKGKLDGEIAKRDKNLQKILIDSEANRIAGEISTVPSAMSRIIKERLTTEWDGDELKTVVLDADGKASDITVADLTKEIVSNKEFSGIIKGSQASGSGASPGDGGQGGAFSVADYKNEDGTVNWGKVAKDGEQDAGLLGKVKEAIGQSEE